jgi:hypothetical protein
VETQQAVSLDLPAGCPWQAGELQVRNSAGDWPAGTTQGPVWDGGPQYAELLTPDGDVYLMGWLGGGFGELSARSTAQVLLFFQCGAFTLLPEQREEAVAFVARSAAVDDLAAALEAALAGGAHTLGEVLPGLQQALQDACAALLAERPSVQENSILIDPLGTRSGLRVESPGSGVITIANSYRRRATAWVRRIGYVPASGTGFVDTQDPAEMISLEPTSGFGSLVGLVYDFLLGQGLYTEKVSKAIPVARSPSDAAKTRYEVIVVGPGLSFGPAFGDLDDGQVAELLRLWLRTALFDVALPVLGNVVLPSGGALSKAFGDPEVVASVLGVLGKLEKAPGLREKALAGDAKGFFSDVVKMVLEGELKAPIYDAIRNWFLRGSHGNASLLDLNFVTHSLAVFDIADAIGTGVDTAAQAYHIARSNEADRWQVDVLGSKVTLSPTSAQLVVGQGSGSVNFTATVAEPAPPGQFYKYVWKNTASVGFITASGKPPAPEIETTQNVVAYSRNGTDTGSDSITVEVYAEDGQNESLVGGAQGKVTVIGSDPRLEPSVVSVHPGGSYGGFHVTWPTGVLRPAEPLQYLWSCAQAHGTVAHPALGVKGTDDTAAYTADGDVSTPQTETLTVQVYGARDGVQTLLGTASAEIRIEDKLTVLPAAFQIDICPRESGRSSIEAVVPVAPPAGAVSLHLIGENGQDPLYYGSHVSITAFVRADGTWNGLFGDCGTQDLPDDHFALSGGTGPDADLPNSQASLQSRFGGFDFRIEVTYGP